MKELQKQVVNATLKGEEVKITSVQLVELINRFRVEEGNMTEKRHDHLMDSIRSEIKALETLEIRHPNFWESSYINSQNKQQPCFEMNKAGALQMLNKESAVVRYRTTQYIEKLEYQVKHKPLTPQEELRLHYAVLEEQQQELNEVKADVADLKENMPLFNIDCKELQELVRKKGIESLGGYKSQAYNDKSLRSKVYSDIQNQLRREFGVNKYERIKHSQLELAKQIVNTYKIPVVLLEQVQALNNQTSLLNE